MIVPCIDLMNGKVVQLVQGRDKALEIENPDEMLQKFAPFPQVQVIDLDAAMGKGSNDQIVEYIARKAVTRIGGGVRTVQSAQQLVAHGAYRVIVGTSAFMESGINDRFLKQLAQSVGADKLIIALDSKDGRIVVKGWQQSTGLAATEIIAEMEPYCSGFLCTYVDKEGMMQGTDLDWFASLRKATRHEITAAGGITTMDDIRELTAMRIDCAVGMAIYTGRLNLEELAMFESAPNRSE